MAQFVQSIHQSEHIIDARDTIGVAKRRDVPRAECRRLGRVHGINETSSVTIDSGARDPYTVHISSSDRCAISSRKILRSRCRQGTHAAAKT
ncbi:MAG: hypothetical protein KGQ75_10685 [Sphingomonadales bacterium]|nr:hypothetical protein [Sphingomonadales bacterium]